MRLGRRALRGAFVAGLALIVALALAGTASAQNRNSQRPRAPELPASGHQTEAEDQRILRRFREQGDSQLDQPQRDHKTARPRSLRQGRCVVHAAPVRPVRER